jgi:hypothetical protein
MELIKETLSLPYYGESSMILYYPEYQKYIKDTQFLPKVAKILEKGGNSNIPTLQLVPSWMIQHG